MKDYFTNLTFEQNEELQARTKIEVWVNEAEMVVVKVVFCIAVFLSITIESNGQSMTFAENDINSTTTGFLVSGNMLTNDFDPTNSIQWLRSVTFFNESGSQDFGQIGGRPFQIFAENGIFAGTISIYLNGKYEFNPNPTFKGKVPIQYVVENTSGATDVAMLVIQVIPANNPFRNDNPIAHNDTNTTLMDMDVAGNVITTNDYDPENSVLTIGVGFADLDGDGIREDSLNIGTEVVVYGKNMVGNPMMAGVIMLNSDGNYSFDPVAEFYGKLAVDYIVTDGYGGVDKANLTISVLPDTGNLIFANDDIVVGKRNLLQFGNILTNDQGPESDLQTVISAKNNYGISLTIDGTTENEFRSGGSLIIDMDGSFTYIPKQGFIGTESIAYITCGDDGPQIACDTATLYLMTTPHSILGMVRVDIGASKIHEKGLAINDAKTGKNNRIADDFSLYPNPGIVGDDFINLSFNSITGKTQIQIADANGRIIRRLIADTNTSGLNSLQIDVANLTEGRYHLQLIDGPNEHSETFIILP